uniref:Clathrin heavy chain n=1 Tax=Piliocolobus tephrosceles TaxID=591936 RepID=A0A8C9GDC7_9PRIM
IFFILPLQLSPISEKFICVKENVNDNTQVVVINLQNKTSTRKYMKADSVIIHPKDPILALRGTIKNMNTIFLQVFNIETKEKICSLNLNEYMTYWKWINNDTIAIVCEKNIYHWNIDIYNSKKNKEHNNNTLTKVFEKAQIFVDNNSQILHYTTDKDMKWCILCGIFTQDQGKSIDGYMQLYSCEKKLHQTIEGFIGCFGNFIFDNLDMKPLFCFIEKKKNSSISKLHLMDIYTNKSEGVTPHKIVKEINLVNESLNDFPIYISMNMLQGVIYVVTKYSYVYIFDEGTLTLIIKERISEDNIFICCDSKNGDGIYAINKKGKIFYVTLNYVQLMNYLKVSNFKKAAKIICLLKNSKFHEEYYSSSVAEAILLMIKKNEDIRIIPPLRTQQVLNNFKYFKTVPGQLSPLLLYFSVLLDYDKLNTYESLELVKPVVLQKKREYLEKWIKDDKLSSSEELGDLVKALDLRLALNIYLRCTSHNKIIAIYCLLNMFSNILSYINNFKQVTFDYVAIFIIIISENNIQFDINGIIDYLLSRKKLQEATSILLDYLKDNKPEHKHLQTKLFEFNLYNNVQVAETLFQMDIFTYYDKHRIAYLCEENGLYQRALENYTNISDIKRVINKSTFLSENRNTQYNLDIGYFSTLSDSVCEEILFEFMKTSKLNMELVIAICVQYYHKIGIKKIINKFEESKNYEGIFYFIKVHFIMFKYIEACVKINNIKELDRICKDKNAKYNPEQIKNYLKECRLSDPRPLIYVCDIHGYIEELAEYLYKNSLLKYIEVYVIKVNPSNANKVISVLLDLDASEEFLLNLLNQIKNISNIKHLIDIAEKRNRLKLLLPWLETRANEGYENIELHNALAKIYIDLNKDPESFLKTNNFYDKKLIGKYCEDLDSHLAYIAYERSNGECDKELINITSKNGLFKLQAKYLVKRQSMELWKMVLDESNKYRKNVIDQVIGSTLIESNNADEITVTVKAFIEQKLSSELIELLEKIVLHNSEFNDNKNLQNLLILTAIKSDSKKVIEYINRLDNFSGLEIAAVAYEYNLREEAFIIYKKFNCFTSAVSVLLDKVLDFDTAIELAQKCNNPDVWFILGKAQLKLNKITDAIDSFIKSNNSEAYKEVIEKCKENNFYEHIIMYLTNLRESTFLKDVLVDSELVYAYAKLKKLSDMTKFISSTNSANLQMIGDRLYKEQEYESAKTLYSSIPNNQKLTVCYLKSFR